MKSFAVAVLVASVSAFPTVLQSTGSLAKRDYAKPGCTTSRSCNAYLAISDAQAHLTSTPNPISAGRNNCGVGHICKTFDAASQYVSQSGQYAYQSPGPNDIRGPCPGLNAAANHGYLPRNGIVNMEQTNGLFTMYGMGIDVCQFLAAYSIAFDGDFTTLTWSIGGPLPANAVNSVLGVPQGDGYSHNNYEGDTSITRCDAYTNGGDAHSSSPTRFLYAYQSGMDNDRYTMDKFARLFAKNTHRSIQQNARYFAPLFSTTVVSPAAHNFILAFMSNHSSAVPGGYLTGAHFKTWFSYTGTYPNFKWNPGQERMPANWYKRPVAEPYNAADVIADAAVEFAAYPDTFRFGGNTNGVNTYTGIDINNFTGGVYNAQNLFTGNNFACFFFQNQQQAVPQELKGVVNNVAAATDLIFKNFPASIGSSLQCPQLAQYDNSVFDKYAGSKDTWMAPKTGPKNC